MSRYTDYAIPTHLTWLYKIKVLFDLLTLDLLCTCYTVLKTLDHFGVILGGTSVVNLV